MDGELIRSLRAEARREAEENEALEWLRIERRRTLVDRLGDLAADGRHVVVHAGGRRFAGRLQLADDHLLLVDGEGAHRVRVSAVDRIERMESAPRSSPRPDAGTTTLAAALTEAEMSGAEVALALRDGTTVDGGVRVRSRDHAVIVVSGTETLVPLDAIVAVSVTERRMFPR